MKNLINKYTIAVVLVGLALSSCFKKFDASSYAPPLNINGYTAASQIASSSLVAHWGFNGDLKDSISGTTAVSTGTSFATGLEGGAYQGANNAYAVSAVPTAIQNLHSFTISVWMNMPENTNGAVGLLSIANAQNFWSNFEIFFDNGATPTTGVLKVHTFNNGTSSTGEDAWMGGYTVNNPWNGWVNICVTYNDTNSSFVVYYNGSSVGTSTVAGFAPLNWSGVQQMVFGTLQFQTTPSLTSATTSQGWASYVTGKLDEVRVYNRVLTSTEVSSLVALQHRGK